MKLGDQGPYPQIVTELDELRRAVVPRRFPAGKKRRDAFPLRSILDGMYDRIETMAAGGYSGLAQILHTEVSGHGGMGVFRRLDTLRLAGLKTEPKVVAGPRSDDGGPNPVRAPPGRGAPRGRGGFRPRDVRNVQCYQCYQMGHMRNNCPNNANRDAVNQ